MKHLKLYDNEPEIGDYVIMKSTSISKVLKSFIENNIGKIIDIDNNLDEMRNFVTYFVTYDNMPEGLNGFDEYRETGILTREFGAYQVVAFGKTKEDVKRKKEYNKFRL